ncbi:hypothetical protein [uncultured Alistipes sp.]|jgi:hypothetical protein|uniref:hypothetical protein n=1 Tax=uncultured Alistipes sp. TaxID=538949 RepID=UPI00259407E9|nr:hypothetical protein [uncultured Alistipes sp.]
MRFFEEIAAREDRNLYEIVLYPEGLFYKAYERSAFACVSRVSPFKPSKKHIKYCARDMVSVGFPAAVLSKYFPSAPRPLADGRVVIALTDRIDPGACEVWKASLPLKERQPRGSANRISSRVPVPLKEEQREPLFIRSADMLPKVPILSSPTTGISERVSPMAVRHVAERDVAKFRTERETPNPRTEKVIRLIREFRLEAATPVECVLFVADLKKEIDGYL